jgi:hypothetical protein
VISVLAVARDELGRLRVWAGNVGAHRVGRISLDSRLREAPHMRNRVVDLLEDLRSSLQDGALRVLLLALSNSSAKYSTDF